MPVATDSWDGLNGFDRLLEHRVRLSILVLASNADAITFSRFKQLLGETDGSLGTHLRKLEDAGYLDVNKEFMKRKPVSWYSLTKTGLSALKKHTASLQKLIEQSA
jgi:DNA-binding transcriptional ArsR family regulator